MRVLRILTALLTVGFLITCATGQQGVRKDVPYKYDKRQAKYPKYRIDDKIEKICVIGSGEGRNEATNSLTSFFMRETNVKVVEPGNLQAILGGKIIEYGTGLTHSESQALALGYGGNNLPNCIDFVFTPGEVFLRKEANAG